MYYWAENNSYHNEAFDQPIPDGAIKITDQEYQEAMDGIAAGKIVKASKKGMPTVYDAPKPKLAQATDLRRAAYRAESDQLYMEWQYDQTEESEQAWRDKVAEIKERYPLPAVS